MQTNNRIFDDLAKVLTSAAGAAGSVRAEVETAVRIQLERIIADMDLVPRDEFDAMKALAVAARDEAEGLKERLAALEETVSRLDPQLVEKRGKSASASGSKAVKLRQSKERKESE